MEKKLDWEVVPTEGAPVALYRAAVPGGWLVLATSGSTPERQPSITFVPDKIWKWEPGEMI